MSDQTKDVLAIIRRGVNDPGSVLPRGDDYSESIGAWVARAVHKLLADAGLLVAPSTSDSPRTWTLPAEPGPEVTAVRDADGDLWVRDEYYPQWWHFRRKDGRTEEWVAIFSYGTVTDATGEATS